MSDATDSSNPLTLAVPDVVESALETNEAWPDAYCRAHEESSRATHGLDFYRVEAITVPAGRAERIAFDYAFAIGVMFARAGDVDEADALTIVAAAARLIDEREGAAVS